jgi:hypothetical protein
MLPPLLNRRNRSSHCASRRSLWGPSRAVIMDSIQPSAEEPEDAVPENELIDRLN